MQLGCVLQSKFACVLKTSGHLGFPNRENSHPWAFQFELTLDSTIIFDSIFSFSLLILILFWIFHDESRDLVNERHIASLHKFKFISSICRACHNESHGNLNNLSNYNKLINYNSSSLHNSEATSSPLLSKIHQGSLNWTPRTSCFRSSYTLKGWEFPQVQSTWFS